jgi:hypothetical protein
VLATVPPWRNKSMSSIESAPATIHATSAGIFTTALADPSPDSVKGVVDQVMQPAPLGQADHWCETPARHEVGVVEDRGDGVRDSHLPNALLIAANRSCASPIVVAQQGIRSLRRGSHPIWSVDPGSETTLRDHG